MLQRDQELHNSLGWSCISLNYHVNFFVVLGGFPTIVSLRCMIYLPNQILMKEQKIGLPFLKEIEHVQALTPVDDLFKLEALEYDTYVLFCY